MLKVRLLACQDSNSLRARASRPAVSFACLNLTTQPRKQNTRHVRSLNIMSVTITRPTVSKRNTSHTVSNANKILKSEVNRANIFCRKKLKQKRV